ncbi:hypothetical protein D4R71_02835 [bacterium]|nr:MAG: hypothetical protein D4R71_02835 [bacterium]
MKKKKLFLISLFILIFVLLAAESNEKSKLELTETDITTIKDFRSDKINVYGVSLGMNQQEVSNIILKNKDLVMEDEKEHSRIRIFDKTLMVQKIRISYFLYGKPVIQNCQRL